MISLTDAIVFIFSAALRHGMTARLIFKVFRFVRNLLKCDVLPLIYFQGHFPKIGIAALLKSAKATSREKVSRILAE